MTEVLIRRAAPEDAEQIAEIEKICFAAPWSYDSILQELTENARAFYLAAEIDGKIIGYAGLWGILDEGHITNVAVRPEYRGRRIAAAIMEHMLEITVSAGIVHHTLEVRRSNESAIKLYRRLGFKEGGVRKGYYLNNGEDALIMWKTSEK